MQQNVTLASGDVEIQVVQTKTLWDQIFTVVDWGFLTAFVIELILKLYAWGPVTVSYTHLTLPTTGSV